MKKLILSIISLFIIKVTSAQNITRTLEDFSALKVSSAISVELTQGDKNEVTISGLNSENEQKLKTEINNNTLAIYTEGRIKNKEEIKVYLTFTNLNKIKQSGASEINSTNTINATDFLLDGSGAIEAKLAFNVSSLSVNFSGASDITLKGNTNNLNLKLSGASDLKASELIAKDVKVDVSGASSVKVHATESITGNAKGASDINVKGNPTKREINQTGASSANIGNDGNVQITIGPGHGVQIENDKVNVKAGKKNVIVNDDTTIVRWRNSEMIMIGDSVHINRKKKKRRNHWAGVDLGINGFFNNSGSLDLSNPSTFEQNRPQDVTQFMELNYRKSWTFSINFLEFFIPVQKHHFGIVTGLGTEWNNYELKHNVRLTDVGGSFVHQEVTPYNENYTWGYIDTTLNYTKNRFKTWFINAPLLLEINTGNDAKRSFHLSAGAILGYNLQTKIKYKYDLNGDNKKEKDKDDFNTNPFRVSLTARAGYGWFNLFATYSLTPLFENGKGPELYPFTVGVTLVGF